MFDEFYLSTYAKIFFKWILSGYQHYQNDHIQCHLQEDNDQQSVILFETAKLRGQITIWASHIVEEEIVQKNNQKMLFYLHYQMSDLSQCKHLFLEFYQTFLKHERQKESQIALCCTGGLSTSVFIEQMNEVCELENIPIHFTSLSLDQLYQNYHNYDALYLAPQIAHLEPEILNDTQHCLPIYRIDPTLFATKNYRSIIQMVIDHSTQNTTNQQNSDAI